MWCWYRWSRRPGIEGIISGSSARGWKEGAGAGFKEIPHTTLFSKVFGAALFLSNLSNTIVWMQGRECGSRG